MFELYVVTLTELRLQEKEVRPTPRRGIAIPTGPGLRIADACLS